MSTLLWRISRGIAKVIKVHPLDTMNFFMHYFILFYFILFYSFSRCCSTGYVETFTTKSGDHLDHWDYSSGDHDIECNPTIHLLKYLIQEQPTDIGIPTATLPLFINAIQAFLIKPRPWVRQRSRGVRQNVKEEDKNPFLLQPQNETSRREDNLDHLAQACRHWSYGACVWLQGAQLT